MKIPDKIIQDWNSLRDHGDITEMANGDDTLRVYISNAFNNKKCQIHVFQLISDFYKARKELLKTA